MLYTGAAVEYRERILTPLISVGAHTDVHVIEVEDRRQTLAAERAVDSALADSFPASDPPSWTPGIARPQPSRSADESTDTSVRHGSDVSVTEDVIVSRREGGRTFLQNLLSLAGAVGIALLVPVAILLVGLPIALVVRGIVEAISWLGALILG